MSRKDPNRKPKIDRNDIQLRDSLKALNNLLPSRDFLLREDQPDKGCDGSIEVLEAGQATNLRGWFQMKSQGVASLNTDGSISMPIEVENINSLLDASCPMYFCWLADRKEMRFAWAREEISRIRTAKPEWAQNDTVNLRLKHVVNADSLKTIRERIVAEARMTSSCHTRVAEAINSGYVAIHVDKTTLEVSDPKQVYEYILSKGMSMVSAGLTNEVLEHIARINAEDRKDPIVQLVAGYASLLTGKSVQADACFVQASLRRAELNEMNQHALSSLNNLNQYYSGRIGVEEFRSNEVSLSESAPPHMRQQHELELLKIKYFNPSFDSDATMQETRQLVADMCESGISEVVTIKAQISLLYMECYDHSKKFVVHLGIVDNQMRSGAVHLVRRAEESTRQFFRRSLVFLNESIELLNRAKATEHDLLTVDAIHTSIMVALQTVADTQFASYLSSRTLTPVSESELWQMREQVKTTVEDTKRLDSPERELTFKLLLADIAVLQLKYDDAKQIAREVLSIAEVYRYPQLIHHCKQHLSDNTSARRRVTEHQRISNTPVDELWAAKSEEEMRQSARYMLKVLDLGEEYLPAVSANSEIIRQFAVLNRDYCRHIKQLLYVKTGGIREFYTGSPMRLVHCELHGYKTQTLTDDAALLRDVFIKSHCNTCKDRSPKRLGSYCIGGKQSS